MATPDLSGYKDLRLLDLTTQQLIDLARADLEANIPGIRLREGHTASLLIEALALEVAELVYSINRVPDAVAARIFGLFGVEPDPGAAPTTTVRFYVSGGAGQSIPVGTRVEVPLSDGAEPLLFTTTAQADIAAGATFTDAPAAADLFTADANGIPAGTTVDNLSAVFYVDRAELAADVVGGRDPETEAAWFDRAAGRVARLVETLALPHHFTLAALERPEVARALTVDNYDPGQAGNPGDHGGHVTVAVYGSSGALTLGQRDAIDVALSDAALANLAVHVVDPTVTAVAVTVTVRRHADATGAATHAAVEQAIRDYLDPQTWEWESTVYRLDLVGAIDRAAGVDRVVSMTAPAGDVALPGVAPLATAGALTVTVQSP